jgi:hypothetical protein
MSYSSGQLANVLARGARLPQRKRFPGRSQSVSHNALIKELARDTINCALAHWYFLPGLELQRYRLRLAFSVRRTLEAAPRGFPTLPPTLCLEAGFALKSIRLQSRIGSYLDVSSPWLFPLYVLTQFKPERSLLLNTSSRTRIIVAQLANRSEVNETALGIEDAGHLSLLSESFDTITCLARLSRNEKDTRG